MPVINNAKECKFHMWEVAPQARPVVSASLGCHVEGAALPKADPSDPNTVLAGTLKRFLMKPPDPDAEKLEGLRQFVRTWVRENLTPLSSDSDCTIETWLSKTSYPAWRKEQLLRKYRSLLDRRDKKHFLVKSFVKDECYPEYKHPRAINSRTDEFKTMVGPVFKLIEKELFALDWFIKKVPVKDRPDFIRDRLGHGLQFFASDYTAYESHFTRRVMEAIERELYDYMTVNLPDREEFLFFVDEVIMGMNTCVFKFFSVDVEATRMSGEMNTSLGNGFSNLMLMLYVCHLKNVTGVAGVVEGDDGLFTGEGELPTADDFKQMGFTIKCEVHDSLSDASFCGLVFDPTDRVIVTNPLEECATFGWTSAQYSHSSQRRKMELLRCKAISLAYQYGGCPILTSLAKYGLRVTQGYRAKLGNVSEWERDQFLEAKMHAKGAIRDVPMNTRFLVERLYGVSVEHQLIIERYLDSLDVVCPLNHPILDLYMPPVWKHYFSHYSAGKGSDFPMTRITTAPVL